MATLTAIDNEKMALYYHEEEKIIHHKVKKMLTTQEFETLLSTGADYLEKYKAKKWLSDDRDNVVISQEANEWGNSVWAPRAIKAGFSYWAVVLPIKASEKLQMSEFVSDYKKRGVTVQVFDDLDKAFQWLRNCN